MLHVSLLGEQAITEDGTSIPARSSRAVALVAFLAAHAGAPQSRQRIAGMFWPESTDAQALTNLRRELHHLRQILGEASSLVVTSRDLCWRDTDTCRVDLRVFTTARAAALAAGDDAGLLVHATTAVECYKGDLLPGVYDEWLLEARSELDRQCADLCDLLGAARARAGDLPGAAQAARRRIQLQPLEEIGYRTLMLLQADLGDRAGAVSTYHHCASVLERELGVIPDPVTRQAFQRLIADSAPDGATRRPVQHGPRSGVAAARLVGRSQELDLLGELWRNAASGTPGLVLIRGGAGVGKSRIAAEIATMASLHGAAVAGSQCFGTSGRLALAPVADWLRHPAVVAASAALDPAWRAEVGRLVPAEGREERGAAGAGGAVEAWQRHRFFEGLARALLAVGRPMLLILDNMQWCDQETLAFITFFLGLAAGTPVLVAATWRNDAFDDDPDLAAWTVRMRATGLLTELVLGPLDAAGTARLAEAISGRRLPEPDADLLQAATGGFPLYIVEAMRGRADAGSSPLPAGDLAAVLRNRLDQASAPAREVAGLAAAVGSDFTLDLLTEASDLDAGTVVGAVDELWRRRIMREYRDGYDFSHDLLRETAYTMVSPPKRWLLHRRVAQAIELLHPDDADAVSAQLADQYARGGRLARAVTYYRRAADVAAGRFAHAEAIRLHTQALSILRSLPEGRDRDRQELEVLHAMAAPLNARYGYSSPELEQAIERALTLAESLGRKDATLTSLVALWTTQFVRGRTVQGYQAATRALALVEPGSEPSGPAHFAVGGSAVSLGRLAEAVHHLEIAGQLASGTLSLSIGTRPDVHGAAFAAHAYWLLGRDDDALSSCHTAIRLARTIGDPYNLAVALGYGCITGQLRHDLPGLRDGVDELRELCERYGFAYYREWVLILDGWSRADASGLDLARDGIGNLKAARSFARMPYWLSLLADIWERAGQPDAARATLDAALVAGQANDDLWWLPEVMRRRAAHDDDVGAAVARLSAAAKLASGQGSVTLLRRCQHDLAVLSSSGVREVRLGSPGSRCSPGSLRRARGGERCANGTGPSFMVPLTHRGHEPKGTHMTATSADTATEALGQLATGLRGELIVPGDPGYDAVRAVYNGMIDKHPAAIARCRDAADVVTCVRFGREHGIELAVRGGGHSAAGLGMADGGLVVDLSLLRSTTVDPQNHTVRADAGCTWGDVDHATVAFGMATPSGFLASTGVAGLTLGGGIGYLSRRFGLTVDNLLAADVVLADGTLVTASASSHGDLFWALRGGGGNFGIVTSFTFRCHDIGEGGTIIGGPVFYDLADVGEVMRWYRELIPSLPEELSGWIALLTVPPVPLFPEELWGRKVCGIVWCYTGSHDRAEAVLEPVKTFGSPLVVGLQPMPFSVLQSTFDPLYPAGLQWYWRADFFNEISDAAIEVHHKYGELLPTGHSTMHMYPIDGATSRVAADATAFAYRDGGWAGVIVGVDPDPANAGRISQWAKDYWQELHPTSAGGAYVNFLMDEGQDRVKAAYRGNYDRLAQIKERYDPDNIFHLNQNIQPAGSPGR